jgi:hypothetical protein
MFKESAIILDAIRWSFLTKSATAAMFTPVRVNLDGHFSRHLLPAPFCLKIENTNSKRLIGSQPHSHKPFAPILVFLSQIRLALKQNFMATLFISAIHDLERKLTLQDDITCTLQKKNK